MPIVDGHEVGLGRLPSTDLRDTAWPMRALIPTSVPLPAYRYWAIGTVLDQGATGTCVGHAWRGWLTASPVRHKGEPDAFAIYRECCAIDIWPENDNGDLQFGTSTRVGAKVLQDRGHISEYRWAFSAQDLKEWVLLKGPAVIGTSWLANMGNVDSKGFMDVSGPVVGGHAYLVIGFDTKRDAFRILNSWSTWWGQRGRAWLRRADFQRLMDQGDAEACAAVERAVSAPPLSPVPPKPQPGDPNFNPFAEGK